MLIVGDLDEALDQGLARLQAIDHDVAEHGRAFERHLAHARSDGGRIGEQALHDGIANLNLPDRARIGIVGHFTNGPTMEDSMISSRTCPRISSTTDVIGVQVFARRRARSAAGSSVQCRMTTRSNSPSIASTASTGVSIGGVREDFIWNAVGVHADPQTVEREVAHIVVVHLRRSFENQLPRIVFGNQRNVRSLPIVGLNPEVFDAREPVSRRCVWSISLAIDEAMRLVGRQREAGHRSGVVAAMGKSVTLSVRTLAERS